MKTLVSTHPIIQREVWTVLGLPFDKVNIDDSVNYLLDAISHKQECFLSTPNLNFAIATQSDAEFFQSVVESDLSIADGMPLIWVAKLLGVPLTERVAGSTLFDELSKRTDFQDKIKVFFFGGQDGIAEQAHQKLNEISNGMESCGFYDPGFVSIDKMSSTEIIEQINSAAPDFLVVALGAKKGQAWIQKNRKQLNATVISHLGAVINFVAGSVKRAPIIWQRFGLEWLWRIRQEPALWKRYFFDGLAFLNLLVFKVLPLAIYDRYLKRSNDFKSPISINLYLENGQSVLRLGGSVHYDNIEPIKLVLSDIILNETDVVIECSDLVYVDSAFIATLLLLQRYLNDSYKQLILCNVPKRIGRIFSLNNIMMRFTVL